jgi:DNA polymerase III subunit delta'
VNEIVGHDAQISTFIAAIRGERMHHAWLMTGPEGVGKAKVAAALAKRMLCEAADPSLGGDGLNVSLGHKVGNLVDASTHPDLIVVERLPKDMKPLRETPRHEWPADVERARNVTVDQVRALGSVFALTPSLSSRRVVIVDSIDDLERGAANALLKSLEEPPQGTVFLLISHAPGRLLPTIRSRCRLLRFEPLGEVDMQRILRERLPNIANAELDALSAAGEGSPGRALAYAGLDLSSMEAALSDIARSGDRNNAIRTTLAQSLSAKSAQKRYEAFLARAPAFIAEEVRRRSGRGLVNALGCWEASRKLADSAIRQSLDPQMTVFALASQVAALVPGANDAKA